MANTITDDEAASRTDCGTQTYLASSAVIFMMLSAKLSANYELTRSRDVSSNVCSRFSPGHQWRVMDTPSPGYGHAGTTNAFHFNFHVCQFIFHSDLCLHYSQGPTGSTTHQ